MFRLEYGKSWFAQIIQKHPDEPETVELVGEPLPVQGLTLVRSDLVVVYLTDSEETCRAFIPFVSIPRL